MSIIIFSRGIRSGKTTELQQWCAGKKNVAGILMPDINGVRHFLNIASGETFSSEVVEETGGEKLSVGKFSFSTNAFRRANDFLLDAVKQTPDTLVIDEVGKLELQHEGLYEAIRLAIDVYKIPTLEKKLILVVREELFPAVIGKFGITDYRLVYNLDQL